MPSVTHRPGGVRVARLIALSQAVIAGFFALGFWLGAGRHAGLSAALGGLISLGANLAFAWWVFARTDSPRVMVRNLFIGEFIKIALTAGLFVAVLVTLEVAFLPLFLTYAASLFAFWIALLRVLE